MDVEGSEVWRAARMLAEESKSRATDFSIAAIMARGAAEPRSPGARSEPHQGSISRQSSPASLSSASSCRSPPPEEDVEVDVEQCSDGEGDASDRAAASPAPSSELERETPSPARPPPPATSCNCEELLAVDCQLETKELWDKFHDLGTEMIITKTGRTIADENVKCQNDVVIAQWAEQEINQPVQSKWDIWDKFVQGRAVKRAFKLTAHFICALHV
ncbi:unnamed protein product [Plutella xylostella]|uniref:(diamondback moth) hypothetical protein n=1 Tax=Plutella xylostella TaxID=51655 RepID=A0A8S4DB41_PLUXY|nr:unnamed protein product [Plutella xylostella]